VNSLAHHPRAKASMVRGSLCRPRREPWLAFGTKAEACSDSLELGAHDYPACNPRPTAAIGVRNMIVGAGVDHERAAIAVEDISSEIAQPE
jgi:hypothetical protein